MKFKYQSKVIKQEGRYIITERLDTDGFFELSWIRNDGRPVFLKTNNRMERMEELLQMALDGKDI